jgi:hypothetical protein
MASVVSSLGNFLSVFGIAAFVLSWEIESSITRASKTINEGTRLQIQHGILERDAQIVLLHDKNNGLHREKSELEQRLRDAVLGQRVCIDVTVSNFNNFLTYIPLYVADKMGFFKEENIEVKFEHGISDLAAIGALGSHSHIAITDPVYAFHPDVRSLDVVLLSPFLHRVALWGAARRPLQELRDNLREHEPTILTYGQHTTAYKLATLFAERNFKPDRKRYTIKEYLPPTGSPSDHQTYLAQLLIDDPRARDCDIIILSEPEVTWIENRWTTHPHLIDLQHELYSDHEFCFTAIAASRWWVQTHPEVARRFLKAIRVAFNFVYALPHLEFDLLALPEPGPARVALERALKNNHLWYQTIQGVRAGTFESYPKRLIMEDVEIAHIIETLRRREYFPRSLAFDDGEGDALRTAYALSYSDGGSEIRSRIYDIRANLQMAAE